MKARTARQRRFVELITAELQERMGYEWNPALGRYRERGGRRRIVSQAQVVREIDRYEQQVTLPAVQEITERFISGDWTLARWQERMAEEIKSAYILNAEIGRGGRDAMTQRDWGRVGGRLRAEYRRLNQMAQDIYDGRLTEFQIRARADLYGNAPRTGFWDGMRGAMMGADFDEEMRLLDERAEHCSDCIEYASAGWVPLGTLPEPGEDSECMHNCKCVKVFRRAEDAL